MSESADPVRVLHVDDDAEFTALVARFLEREGDRISVVTEPDAAAGLDRLDDADVDCIVSDYDMPGRDGIEFLEAVRDRDPDIPFVLFTGTGSEAIAGEAISAGVTDYLQKEDGTDQYAILANRIRNAVERTRAERERRRHLDAIETAREGISILDGDERFTYVNRAYADLYGYDPDELIGERWELLYTEADADEVRAEILPIVEERGYWRGTTTGVRADGSTFVEDHALATTANGELVCTVRDATESARREAAIEKLHSTAQVFMAAETESDVAEVAVEAVRDILDMRANAVHLYDEATGLLEPIAWSENANDITNGESIPTLDPGDSIAGDVFETGEPRVYDDVSTAPGRAADSTGVRSEIILPLGDHGVLLIGASETGAFDETDVSLARTVAAHATTALDGIDRARELREERAFIDQALDTLDDLYYVVGTDGGMERWNDAFHRVTGYDDAEIATMAATEFFPPDERDSVREAIGDVLATGETTVEAELRTADGDRIPYEFTGSRLTDTDGELAGLVGVGRDISDRRERERELRQKNERLDEFASIVSHDLRNPLNVAQGRLALAREECDSEHLDDVEGAHERMEELIADMLAVAHVGESAVDADAVALGTAVEASWANVATDGASLVVDADRSVRADESQLGQLLENLFRNAVEHGSTGDNVHRTPSDAAHQNPADSADAAEHGGPRVEITVGELPDGTGFYVEDDGPGIPAEDRDRIFEAGYSTADGGTGFGLSIVRQVASAHGWRVAATAGDEGGARFEIRGVEFEGE